MIEIGRLCVKVAGRDAGKRCAVVDIINDTFVVIDGQTRRKKCNIKHLEPLPQIIKIGKDAPHGEVVDELMKLGIEVKEKTRTKGKKEKSEVEKGKRKKQ